uniref:Uncharacterized protein n=1 Tax=Astatotilapia calliptera TaxID=8154 RepID=A0A3P8RG61_ASTCA
MKGVVIFLVLTLVLFMAEPVEPRFRSSFQNGLQRFRGKAFGLWQNHCKKTRKKNNSLNSLKK